MKTLQSQMAWCRRAQLSLAGAMLVLVVGFYLLLYHPTQQRLQSLDQQLESLKRDLAANQTRARNLPFVAIEVENLRHRLEKFDKRLPRSQELGQFIGEINQLSQNAALRKLTVQPAAPKRNELYSEMPISLNFEGDFINVFNFLRQTEEMQRLTRVRSLGIRCRDSKLGTVEVQLSLSIYCLEG